MKISSLEDAVDELTKRIDDCRNHQSPITNEDTMLVILNNVAEFDENELQLQNGSYFQNMVSILMISSLLSKFLRLRLSTLVTHLRNVEICLLKDVISTLNNFY